MLPKIIVGWQKTSDEFILEYGLKVSDVLMVNGDSLTIKDFRDWLNFSQNITKASERYVVLIENADSLSAESQSILLKPLEEKKDWTQMYLLVRSESGILPTVISRCEVVTANKMLKTARYWTDMVRVWKGGPSAAIAYCESFSYDYLEELLREVLVRLKTEIGKGVNMKRLKIINCFLQTSQDVSVGNVNKRLALESLLFEPWRLIKTFNTVSSLGG